MPALSATQPMRAGTTAPPTTAVIINPDPLLVIGPSPAMPSAKIFGNMIELKNPHSTSVQIASCPLEAIDNSTIAAAAIPKTPSSNPDLKMVSSHEPRSRPISAPNQYRDTSKVAITTSFQGPKSRVINAPKLPRPAKKFATPSEWIPCDTK